jgi:hypothetical protein
VTQWTNSPLDGPTPIGVPVNNGPLDKLQRLPGRLVGYLLPNAPIPAWLGIGLTTVLPGGLVLLLGWWVWRRFFR